MFELRPYRKNNSLYNPFRDIDEFEKQFFGSPVDFFSNNSLDEFKTDIKDEGDKYTLEADAFSEEQFDAVVANPPFSAEWSAADKFNNEDRFSKAGSL